MAIHYTYDGSTNREELADLISIVSPLDTPLYTLLEHVPSNNTVYEWVMDDISAPTTVGAKLEGADFTSPAASTRQRAQNTHMIYWEGIEVSRTQRLMNEVGLDDEFSWQEIRSGLNVAKQFEANLRWSGYDGGGASTARKMAGLLQWVATTGIDTGTPNVAGVSIPDTYSSSWFDQGDDNITRDELHDSILLPMFKKGAQIGDCIAFCPAELKRKISAFAVAFGAGTSTTAGLSGGGGRVTRSQNDDALVEVVDVYATDVGPLAIAMDRYMNSSYDLTVTPPGGGSDFSVEGERSMFIIDPRFFQISVLDPIHFVPVAKTSDSTQGAVVGEMGLKVLNPRAAGGGSGLTA